MMIAADSTMCRSVFMEIEMITMSMWYLNNRTVEFGKQRLLYVDATYALGSSEIVYQWFFL